MPQKRRLRPLSMLMGNSSAFTASVMLDFPILLRVPQRRESSTPTVTEIRYSGVSVTAPSQRFPRHSAACPVVLTTKTLTRRATLIDVSEDIYEKYSCGADNVECTFVPVDAWFGA